MPRRRRSVMPRDPERTRIARQTTGRIIYVTILSLLVIVLAGVLYRWPLAWVRYWSAWLFGGSVLFLAVKLLEEGLLAPHRRAQSQVWASVDALVRDGIRMISIAAPRDGSTRNGSPTFSPNGKADTLPDEPSTPTRASSLPVPLSSPNPATTDVDSRRDELLGLLAAFPITLQHHLMGTRALPHSPACDLLPLGYLTSLKRTEARVRFASAHAGPSGSGSPKPKVESSETNGTKSGSEEDSDTISATPAKKSNLQIPYPTNLPLSCLRLIEAYIVGLGSLPVERGGWTQLQVERAHEITKGLSANLSQAEDLSDEHALMPGMTWCLSIFAGFLSLWLGTLLPIWAVVLVVPSAAILLEFGVKGLITEADHASSNYPLKLQTTRMLQVSLETCPTLARYYRSRMVARLGASSNEVAEFDRRHRRERDEWLPSFT